MPNLKKAKNDKDEKYEPENLESYIKKKKSQNKALGKLLYNLKSEHIKNQRNNL